MSLLSDVQPRPSMRSQPLRPQIFVRRITTPAAAPWEQWRAAQLEARLAAPVPSHELNYQVRRLGVWSLRRPGRYIACYVRSTQLQGTLQAAVEVDGRRYQVAFRSRAARSRHAGATAMMALVGAAAGVLVASAGLSAVAARAAGDQQLIDLSRSADTRLHIARRRHAAAQEELCIAAVQGESQEPLAVARDLAWAASRKSPGAPLEAVHWEHGLLGVEVRGVARPFTADVVDVMKAAKPLRLGVWLWGVRASSPETAPVHSGCPSS